MRTTIVSRTAIAVLSTCVGLGSVALVAEPVSAAPQPGVTRTLVINAVAAARAAVPTAEQTKALDDLVDLQCGAGNWMVQRAATNAGDDADGLVIRASYLTFPDYTLYTCGFGAVASSVAGFALKGAITLTGTDLYHGTSAVLAYEPLSGDVFATTSATLIGGGNSYDDVVMTATGEASGPGKVTTTVKVADKKTKAEKKAAKKKYAKRLKAAKKAYQKALKRAGRDTTARSAAKKRYVAAKKSARAKYRYAIADYKLVTRTKKATVSRPFSLTATVHTPL